MMKLTVQHTSDTFPTLTDLDYLTKHITLKLFPFVTIQRSAFILTTSIPSYGNTVVTAKA